MKKLLLVLLALPLTGFGQNVNIPDANFKAYLLGNSLINTNGDTEIQVSEASVFNGAIYCYNMNISDLTGIEAFTALTDLYCYFNQLTSLDVSQNTALIQLWCYDNLLSSLDVSQNTALTRLECGGNQLSSLDVSQNTALNTLYCNNNQLSSLDVSQNTALTALFCWNNQLDSLDVSQNTALTYLECEFNLLTSLNVNGATALTDLYCYFNQLTSLDVSQNTALTRLECWDNQLTSLDVSQNTALTYLHCGYNQLTSLDVSQNTALTVLRCGYNQLTSLDLRNGNNINLITSGWEKLNLTNNPNLYCIDVDDVGFSITNWTVANGNIDSTVSFSANCATAFGCLDSLACNYNPLVTIDDGSCGYNTASYDTLVVSSNIVWNGIPLNVSGDYSVTLPNSAGCDSIVYLNLTVTTTGISDIANNKSKLIKITDMLGQETPYRRNTTLFYIYNDGTVEKKVVIE